MYVQVRDLVNEEELAGVSQGKLSVFIDMVEQNKAEENPIEDIQVLGKTLSMELRIIIWNTLDTAPKDNYTSDVYVSCELMGVGQVCGCVWVCVLDRCRYRYRYRYRC